MISRIAPILVATSSISILMTYVILSNNLPLSFLIYVIIITFGIGFFAFGSTFKHYFEIREFLESRNLLISSKNELKAIEISVKNLIEELDKTKNSFKSILSAISELDVWIFEVEGDKIVKSMFSENILGIKDSETVGKKIEDIFVKFNPNGESEVKGKVKIVELKSSGNIFIARNIERRKNLERELALLKTVFEHSIDAIVLLDLDSKIVSWNKGAELMFGYKAEEVIGKPFTIIVPQEFHETCRKNFKKAILEGYAKDIESIRIAKNGEKIIVDQTLTSIYNEGELIGFVSIMRDITKRKEMEMKLLETCDELERKTNDLISLQRELEYLARIVETSNDAIYSVDAEGKIKSWNRTAEKLLGWKREEIIGKDSSILLPEEIKNETAVIMQRIRDGQRELRFETRRLTKGGEIISVDVTVSPLDNSGFSVILRPIADSLEKRMFRFNVERGRTYFTKDIYQAIEVLKDLKSFGYNAVIVSRRFPEEFKIDARFYWLSDQSMDFGGIYDFIATLEGWRNAVLIDLDYMLIKGKFNEAFTLIQKLRDIYYILNKGIIIVHSAVISKEEEALLRAECLEIKAKASAIPPEAFEILKLVYTKARFGEKLSIKDIMNELGVTRNTIKKRLSYLTEKGLIRVVKEGREKVIEITDEGKAIVIDAI
jgi:PAS domain S-box-containing protein